MEDEAHAEFYEHTAPTREKAERARAELESRGVDIDDSEKQITTDEWLELEGETREEDDAVRDIAEEDHAIDPEDLDFFGEDDAEEVTVDTEEPPTAEPDDMRTSVAKAQEALARVWRAQNQHLEPDEPEDTASRDDDDASRDTAAASMFSPAAGHAAGSSRVVRTVLAGAATLTARSTVRAGSWWGPTRCVDAPPGSVRARPYPRFWPRIRAGIRGQNRGEPT